MIEVLTDNHYEKIIELFDGTEKNIKIISPFISLSIAKKLCELLKNNQKIKCQFITRFYLEDMIAKANSMEAIEMMMNAGIEVYALKGLHTKLYLFDSENAVLGSANFTAGGFISNVELSIHFENEKSIISELNRYFDDLLKRMKGSDEALITREMLQHARELYKSLLAGKKQSSSTRSVLMYGASLDKKNKFNTTKEKIAELDSCVGEVDAVHELFKQTEIAEQKKYDFNIWLKFSGESDNRLVATEGLPMTDVTLNGKRVYLSNYPYNVFSVKDNDEIYFAALTTDLKGKNQPVIVGRGHLREYSKDNHTQDIWIKNYPWMERYPYYTIISDAKIIDTSVNNGIPMDEIWEALGSNTYICSFGKNEPIDEVAKKHRQKAHMRLSGNAKDYIDKRLDDLETKYGLKSYISEI